MDMHKSTPDLNEETKVAPLFKRTKKGANDMLEETKETPML